MREIKDMIIREVKRKNLTNKDFANRIGMTEAGFYRALKANDLKLSTLDKMGKVLNIEMESFFFDDENLVEPQQKKSGVSENYVKEWETKEKQYQQTIKQLLSTITNLSLGKRRGVLNA